MGRRHFRNRCFRSLLWRSVEGCVGEHNRTSSFALVVLEIAYSKVRLKLRSITWGRCVLNVYYDAMVSLRYIDKQWKSLRVQMDEFVLRRKEELGANALDGGKQRHDLFSRLVGALDDEAKVSLSMSEVVSPFDTSCMAVVNLCVRLATPLHLCSPAMVCTVQTIP